MSDIEVEMIPEDELPFAQPDLVPGFVFLPAPVEDVARRAYVLELLRSEDGVLPANWADVAPKLDEWLASGNVSGKTPKLRPV